MLRPLHKNVPKKRKSFPVIGAIIISFLTLVQLHASFHFINPIKSKSTRSTSGTLTTSTTSTTSKSSNLTSWEEKTFDCRRISMEEEELHGGMFVKTSTRPSFAINIHNPQIDKFVSGTIYYDGCWEKNHVKAVLHALSQYPNAYLMDLGANIGIFTLAAAANQRTTFSFEPNVRNYERICKSVQQNSFHKYVNLFNIAVTSKVQPLHQVFSETNMGGSEVNPITKENNNVLPKNNADIVQGLPIDSLNLPTHHPYVMKIDIEGHELDALMGATNFLNAVDIVFVMMELRPDRLKEKQLEWKSIFDIFTSKGLKPYRFSSHRAHTPLNVENFLTWTSERGYANNELFDVMWKKRSSFLFKFW